MHNDYNIELKYDENVLRIVDSRIHLSLNNKWINHIETMIY